MTAYAVSFLVLTAACKKKEDDPTLSADKSELTLIGYSGYSDSIQVNASSTWKVEIPADVKWLEADQQEGAGNATLRFRIIKENNANLQQATVKLTSGSVTQSLVLKQLPHYANAKSIVVGGSNNDYLAGAVACSDGGFVVVGNTQSTNGDFADNTGNDENAFIVKYGKTGNIEWKKFLSDGSTDRWNDVACTATGDIVIIGSTNGYGGTVPPAKGEGDFWIQKLDKLGNPVWIKRYGGPGYDGGITVCIAEDGNIFVAGMAERNGGDVEESNGGRDAWVLKLNSDGGIIWKKCIGGVGDDYPVKMVIGKDGNLLLCGVSGSSGDGTGDVNLQQQEAWLFKMNQSGTLLWSKVFGGNGQDQFTHLSLTTDGGILAGGFTGSEVFNGQSNDGFSGVVIKLNGAGVAEWTYLMKKPASSFVNSTFVTRDRGYLVAGHANGSNDAFLLLISPEGKLLWNKNLGGSSLDQFNVLFQTTENKIVAAGISHSNDGVVGKNNGDLDSWIHIFE